jgi:DNA repair exonuclease SbcCD nuclease subunit
MDQIFKYAVENNITKVIFGGDLFHTKSYLDTATQSMTFNKFYEYHKLIDFYLIPGNHDMAEKGAYNALSTFKGIATVIEEPMSISLEENGSDDCWTTFVPYQYDKKVLLDFVSKTKTSLLIAHEGIITATPNGHPVDEGVTLNQIKSGGHKKIFLGHYHDPECLKDGVVEFIGSPLHTDSGDNTQRGFVVYDTETNIVKRVNTDYPSFIVLTDKDMAGLDQETLEEACRGNYVSFNLTKDYPVLTELRKAHLIEISIKKTPIKQEQRLDIKSGERLEDVMKKYIDKYSSGLDKKKLLKIGVTLKEEGSL